MKPYPKYKDSGLDWLGDVPESWEVRRNGRLFAQRNETGFADLCILEVSLRTGVRVRDFENSARKQVMSDRDKYKRALAGDIAYNMMRMWQDAVGVAPVDGLISPAYVVARPLPGTVARYYERLFRTPIYMQEVDNYSRGIVKDRNRLYWEDFKAMPTCYPPPKEQAAIVRYLDHVDRRVRRLVRAKQKLIGLLVEQKQAIIHRAVTRGLDPNVPLKPSGVEWLGDVPEHWDVSRFKRVAGVSGGLVDPRLEEQRTKVLIAPNHIERDGTARLLGRETAGEQGADSGKYEVRAGEIIYCKIRPYLRKAVIAPIDCLCSADMYPIALKESAVATYDFLLLEMLSLPFTQYTIDCSLRAAMPKINRQALGEAPVWLPPLPEQAAIVTHLGEATEGIDAAVDRARREIELLREYRTRLIADVVTGKLDVREAAANLPDEPDEPEAIDETDDLTDSDDAMTDDLDAIPEEAEA